MLVHMKVIARNIDCVLVCAPYGEVQEALASGEGDYAGSM